MPPPPQKKENLKCFMWYLNGINWTEPELGNCQFCQTWFTGDLEVVSFLCDPPKDLCCFVDNGECGMNLLTSVVPHISLVFVVAILWRFFYTQNNGTYSDFPLQFLRMDWENQKHGLALREHRKLLRCLEISFIFWRHQFFVQSCPDAASFQASN